MSTPPEMLYPELLAPFDMHATRPPRKRSTRCIDWARYAEIFGYDDQGEIFSLEDPKG